MTTPTPPESRDVLAVLDVTVLAEALRVVTRDTVYAGDKSGPKWRWDTAIKLAAEYARLAATPAHLGAADGERDE